MKLKLFFLLVCLILNTEIKSSETGDILIITDDNSSSAVQIAEDALSAGYAVNSVSPDFITLEIIESYRLTIVSTGNNIHALQNNFMRYLLHQYVLSGGKIIVEGGENAYVSLVYPMYPAFQNKVLKVINWTAHNGGNLRLNPDFSGSTLATTPNFLSQEINLNINQFTDMDVCQNDPYSDLFYETTSFPGKAGIVVYPSVSNPRIINYFFNYSSVESRSQAKNLLINSVYNIIGDPVSVTKTGSSIPSEFQLKQNYPNPFNSSTKIEFSIPKRAFVKVTLYNIVGSEIENILKGEFEAGTYSTLWNAENLASGFYYYIINAGEFTESKKMTLLK